MTGSLLMRGMLIGVLAGVIAFFFAYIFGEPQVDLAIAFEEQMAQAEADAIVAAGGTLPVEGPELVSRETQATIGLATGLLMYGAAIGGLFSLAFAFAYGRLGDVRARGTSALLAVAAFVAVVVVPLMKYPANPPAVGSDDTIVARTSLFFIILVISLAAMVVTFILARRLAAGRGTWSAATIAGVFYLGVMALAFTALPTIAEMPDGFSPQVVWDFRVSSFGIHLILWTVIGLGFGALAERLMEGPAGLRRLARV
jgi:hypothetical protein